MNLSLFAQSRICGPKANFVSYHTTQKSFPPFKGLTYAKFTTTVEKNVMRDPKILNPKELTVNNVDEVYQLGDRFKST